MATFFERTTAYFIDMIVVNIILLIISFGIGNYDSPTNKKMEELDNKLRQAEITEKEYLNEYKELLYEYQKENSINSGITIASYVAYYVIFQYMNKGQTIGKMLLKIRVVDKNNNKPVSILKGFIRSSIIYNLLSGIIAIITSHILNVNEFIYTYIALMLIEGIFILVTILLVLYKKDKRGLHDIMTNTIVIKEK